MFKPKQPGAYFAFLLLLTFPFISKAQSPGLIVRPAGGNGITILNPNGDPYSSSTTSGFLSNDISESEIAYKIVPPIITEPTGDLATGPSGGFTDIVKTVDNSGFYTFYDGTNLLFRLRIGGIISGSKGYSVLLDTDGKMGNAGKYADPNYVAPTNTSNGNPGFEYEIVLQTNFNVSVYNIDGTQNPVLITSYSLNTNSQISVALSTDSGTPDYFYDFGVPLSAIGSPSSFRMAATTVTAPSSALQGSRSDIYGIADNSVSSVANAWQTVINAQSPISITDIGTSGSGVAATCTAAPTIASPITPGTNVSVTGSWTRLDASKPSTATITLYKNNTATSTTTLTTGNNWSFVVSNIASGDVFYAKAQATGESSCLQSASVTAGCTSIPSSPVLTCASSKGISGTIDAGNTILIYLLPTTNAAATSNPLTTNITYPTSTSFAYYTAGCSGGSNNVANGTYMLIASNGSCNSAPVFECITSGSSALTGLVANSISLTTPIYPYQSTVNGTGSASGNILHLFINGKYTSTITATGTSFSFTGLSLNANDQLKIYINTGASCMTVSNAFTLSCYTQPPVISTNANGRLLSTATTISGTSDYPGASVTLYKGTYPSGVATGSVATTDAAGNWSVTSLTLTAGDNYYATQTYKGCTSTASVAAAVLAPTTVCPSFTGSYTDASTTISGTMPSSFTGTVKVYLDGTQIGSASMSAATTWSISAPFTYPLYPGAVLTATAQATGSAENFTCSSSSTISCTSPLTPSASPTSATINTGQAVTLNVSNVTSNAWYAVLDNGGTSYATSIYKSTSTSFNLTTNKFNTAGTYNLKLSADKLSGCPAASQAFSVVVTTPLPVSLIDFTGANRNGTVKLEWTTAFEQNSNHFIIERSLDGSVFAPIGKTQAAGNSQASRHYAFTDANPGGNYLYYRLKSVDNDGGFKYSKVIAIKINTLQLHAIAPNPFTNELHLSVELTAKQMLTIQLLDAMGRMVYNNAMEKQKGVNNIHLTGLDHLPKGLYYISISAGDQITRQKIIKIAGE